MGGRVEETDLLVAGVGPASLIGVGFARVWAQRWAWAEVVGAICVIDGIIILIVGVLQLGEVLLGGVCRQPVNRRCQSLRSMDGSLPKARSLVPCFAH